MLAAENIALASRLTQVSLALEPGKVTAICGPNGAGKSSLLQLLAGLMAADSGTVTLDGRALASLRPRERARSIGYLPQDHEVAWDVPVHSLVGLGRMPHGDRACEPVERALEALDIAHLADRRAQSLSGGETARVLLARVLAGEPRWILADEPLAALDLGHQLSLMSHLARQARAGRGVVLVLHDLAMAMNAADRVVVLDRGRLVADGVPGESLAPDIIEKVWGVRADWRGEAGHWALMARSAI